MLFKITPGSSHLWIRIKQFQEKIAGSRAGHAILQISTIGRGMLSFLEFRKQSKIFSVGGKYAGDWGYKSNNWVT